MSARPYPFRHDLTMTLRGIEVTVEFNAESPEPDVGMFGYQLDEYRISDDGGNALDWVLTEDETNSLATKVDEQMRDSEYDDFE